MLFNNTRFSIRAPGNRKEYGKSTQYVICWSLAAHGNRKCPSFFSAEVDAVDADLAAVEVKISNAKNWGTKTMFQMISSGSSKICHGIREKEQIPRADIRSLSDITEKTLRQRPRDKLESNVLRHMSRLHKLIRQFEPDCILVLSFDSNNELQLALPGQNMDFIPSSGVITDGWRARES